MPEPLVALEKITFAYPTAATPVLDALDFTFSPGDHHTVETYGKTTRRDIIAPEKVGEAVRAPPEDLVFSSKPFSKCLEDDSCIVIEAPGYHRV